MKVLQGNLHRSIVAQSLLQQLQREKAADIIIVSEQHHDQDGTWLADDLGTAAIWSATPGQIEGHGAGEGFVWLKRGGVTFISCYFTPNESVSAFEAKLGDLEDTIRATDGNMIVAGDFNGKALEWGMSYADRRGRLIMEMVARTGLEILNQGSTPTFRRAGQAGTIPDISMASESLVRSIHDWSVIEDYTGSDHQYITFSILECRQEQTSRIRRQTSWNLAKMDREKLARSLMAEYRALSARHPAPTNPEEAEELADGTVQAICKACDASMPRKKQGPKNPPVYWWNEDIAALRAVCLRARRRAQRTLSVRIDESVQTEYREARRELRRAINASKANCWQEVIDEIEENPWGRGYKIVCKKLKKPGGQELLDEGKMERIVSGLFPCHPPRERKRHEGNGVPLMFTEEELKKVVSTLKNGKAPGPDGVPSEVLKITAEVCPNLLLDTYNACLRTGVFSKKWKRARLVLLDKGKGDPNAPSSWRPLCMLDTIGKGYEKLLLLRLQAAIAEAGDLSPRQHGFRKGHSTIDAISEVLSAMKKTQEGSRHTRRMGLVATLDVKNAFNSATWESMMRALEFTFEAPPYLLNVLEDYLSDRLLLYDTAQGPRETQITAGAAQGSILGPTLWNASYDDIFQLGMPEDTFLVGYADDVAAVILARSTEQAQEKLGEVMRTVKAWMDEHSLSLAMAKTELVFFTRKRVQTILRAQVGDTLIDSKPAVRYLGVMLDSKINFGEHIKRTADKAAKTTAALSRLMANMGGPRPCKRRVLMSVVHSTLLYGAEVWSGAMSVAYHRKRLLAVQRRGALRIVSAYRTVSEPAVMVLAGTIPIHLLAMERQRIYEKRGEGDRNRVARLEREQTLSSWQESWAMEHRGRWTARLIPDIAAWTGRRHGEVNYFLTQFLSGHGLFYQYLHKMRIVDSPICLHCAGLEDSVYHTFFECTKWTNERRSLEGEIGAPGPLSPEHLMEKMLANPSYWRSTDGYVREVLSSKMRLEMARQRAERSGDSLPG